MIRSRFVLLAVALVATGIMWLCPAVMGQSIPDPGAIDWFYPGIPGGECKVGESIVVPLLLIRDEPLEGITIDLHVYGLTGFDTGTVVDVSEFALLDSVTFLPYDSHDSGQVLDSRSYVYTDHPTLQGVDSLSLVMQCSNPPHVPLAPRTSFVESAVAVLWFTGVAPGCFELKVPDPTSVKLFPDGTPVGETGYFVPSFEDMESRFYVVDSTEPPDPPICSDPGLPDYGSLAGNSEGYPLGESMPVSLTLVNDEALDQLNFTVTFSSVDIGAIQVDSVHYVDRWADPRVNSLRFPFGDHDGVMPESIGAWTFNVSGVPIPSGTGAVVEIFITATVPGDVAVSASCSAKAVCPAGSEVVSFSIPVAPTVIGVGDLSVPQPVFENLINPAPFVAGQLVTFNVQASSPVDNPVEVELESLYLYDSLYGEPVSQPTFAGDLFTWVPDPADVAIWNATFLATDQVSGRAAKANVVIQVVSDPQYQLPFQMVETEDALPANAMVHGDYDSDGLPEILVCGDDVPNYRSLVLYDYVGFGQLQELFSRGPDGPNRGLVAGYINEDDYLDAVTCMLNEVLVLLGDGSGGFIVQNANVPRPSGAFIDAVLSDCNDDAYLDYVCLSSPSRVTIYAGGPSASFAQSHTFNAGAPGLSLASADLNGDGRDDLIVGTNNGLEAYLNSGSGTYALAYAYTCNLGTYDIDITDQGSDFNGDGIYDLCIAAPGTGPNEGLSDLEIHLGQGDGTYSMVKAEVLYGTVCGNRAGDFNGDGLLDIAFINSTERYLAILFGEESGEFRNQIRFDIPNFLPRQMDCMDIDADGDLDIVVSAFDFDVYDLKSSLCVFLNGLNPVSAVKAPTRVAAIDNVDIELVAPNGARLNKVSSTLASASLYRKNINGNSCLDVEVMASSVEPGPYFLRVTPRPNPVGGETFSLNYSTADGQTYEIAQDLPVPTLEYVFPIFPDGQSTVMPLQGARVTAEHPVLEWDSTGGPTIHAQSSLPFSDRTFNLRVASDPVFENLIETATIEGHSYTLQTALDAEEETPYYWQVRPSDQTDWGGIFIFHALPSGPTDVDDDDSEGTDQNGVLPTEFALQQNYPNPFNPATGIPYSLAHASHVRLEVFNVLGMLVTTLVDEYQGPGNYEAIWNANELSSGMYLYRLTTDEFSATKKMILLK